jgi:hypothetical protein
MRTAAILLLKYFRTVDKGRIPQNGEERGANKVPKQNKSLLIWLTELKHFIYIILSQIGDGNKYRAVLTKRADCGADRRILGAYKRNQLFTDVYRDIKTRLKVIY